MSDALPAITPADLHPGDVLLSRGIGDLSDMIGTLDGGLYSHGALWTGNTVIHATLGGIVPADLAGQSQQQFTDVYRYVKDDEELGSPRWPREPVIKHAESFLGGSYAYSDLMMLAVLIGYGRRPGIPVMQTIVLKIGAHMADKVTAWFQKQMRQARKEAAPSAAKTPRVALTCTELVATAFYEAKSVPEHDYALEVVQPGREASTTQILTADPEVEARYESVAAACRDLIQKEFPPLEPALELQRGGAAFFGLTQSRTVIAGRDVPLSMVTPRDLQTSPTLVKQGRLSL